jgi:hypothetical protein
MPGSRQVLWGDTIFVRDFSRLDLIGSDELMRMATLLHDCHQSFDLVYHLLIEHDKRNGGSLAGTYLRNIKPTIQAQERLQ